MNTYVISLFFINYLCHNSFFFLCTGRDDQIMKYNHTFHYFRMCTRKNERRSEILFDLMILYM